MFKTLLPVLTIAVPLLSALPALAIAPGVEQADFCANYTADRFRVTLRDVRITNFRRQGANYKVYWTIPNYRGSGSCLVNRRNQLVNYDVDRYPQIDQSLGPNEKRFNNLPGYGDVIVNRGQGAIGERQYFLVKSLRTGRIYKWYARCAHNPDQVYDERGKYVGNNQRLTVMFPYVCEISPLSRPSRPQPR